MSSVTASQLSWIFEETKQQPLQFGKYEYMTFRDRLWIKIFYHNSSNNVAFDNENQALNCNEPQKYSILNEIRPYHKINNNYEFLLLYPKLPKEYNHWMQANAPNKEIESSSKRNVSGYQPISISWTYHNWGGLAKSTIKLSGKISTFIDGTRSSSEWFYAIGKYYNASRGWSDSSIAGPNCSLSQVYLWMRVRSFADPYTCPFKNKIKIHLCPIKFLSIILQS